ncbi:MAG: Lrp/AsnC family transcriptional regulator, partial [Zoogloea sp.]|nr:Lrp/AsnC family transcriptional regulator [Zoogloea sp.]
MIATDTCDFSLLNDFQRDFPLVTEPWAAVGARIGCAADEVLARLTLLRDNGKISRVGPVFAPNRIGASTLAAMAVPVAELPRVVAIVNAFSGVNHNYLREHRYNLWFVASATDEPALAALLADMGAATGCPPIALPL